MCFVQPVKAVELSAMKLLKVRGSVALEFRVQVRSGNGLNERAGIVL